MDPATCIRRFSRAKCHYKTVSLPLRLRCGAVSVPLQEASGFHHEGGGWHVEGDEAVIETGELVKIDGMGVALVDECDEGLEFLQGRPLVVGALAGDAQELAGLREVALALGATRLEEAQLRYGVAFPESGLGQRLVQVLAGAGPFSGQDQGLRSEPEYFGEAAVQSQPPARIVALHDERIARVGVVEVCFAPALQP